ncbi:protein gamma response 1-like [Chenopodium quinoa]|uniref:protein gamma response 1-like n=1 Tax=Chenopodium quinoa TaxID=63459 RepID=UPI000B785531|nr:protein gamma response 1-like [Chenopodium quinoa]
MHITELEKSPKVSHQVESHDTKYVSGLSTILVATIQEAKDRISQIEYIFCSQLYPNIQTSAKSVQKIYVEARNAAENEWKERQSKLELQMKQLILEKELVLDECKAFMVEKSRLATRVAELEDKLQQKTKEVEDAMESHATLHDIIEAKSTTLRDRDLQVKEHEERMKLLVNKSQELEGKIDALDKELQDKNEDVTNGKELVKELQRQIDSQELKMRNTEQMLIKSEEENKQLSMKLENVETSLDSLRNGYRRKIAEADEGKQLREQLVHELTKKNQLLSALEGEKKMLGEKLQESLRNRDDGVINTRVPQNDLVKQIELKTTELATEKHRRRDLHAAYKRLKSQHSYLLNKFGLTNEELLLQMKEEEEEEGDPLNDDETILALSEVKKRNLASSVVACELNEVKQEINTMESSDDEKFVRLNQKLSSKSSSGSDSPTGNHWTTSRKTRNLGSLTGGKRPISGWRETRSRQSPGGPDPHDDFLDTPYEDIRGNLHKSVKASLRDVPAVYPKDTDSDDETQDMRAESAPKRQQLQAPRSGDGSKGFKYVEPVRKKAERENLNGIECKQCKKFYDAVLSNAKDGEVDGHKFWCEHHEGVSRHRYRYAPPLTPEGFWNIGFDTET